MMYLQAAAIRDRLRVQRLTREAAFSAGGQTRRTYVGSAIRRERSEVRQDFVRAAHNESMFAAYPYLL
jgi:hypothetical protein